MVENSPATTMEQLATAPLKDMLSSLAALSTLLATSNSTSTYSALPGIISSLTSADDDLTVKLKQLRQHQANYARILDLRAKLEELDTEIRSIIRQADSLRTEIGQINGKILEDSDSDTEPQDVDYETLLSFAARIGKHNNLAAQEAEREARERALESRTDPGDLNTLPNNDDIARQKEQIDIGIAQQRAAMGMAFPDNAILRLGALGALQMLREGDRGEAAVDDEVQRLIKSTEPVALPEEKSRANETARMEAVGSDNVGRGGVSKGPGNRGTGSAASPTDAASANTRKRSPKKKTLSLDFDDESDEEDEEEDE